MVGAFHGLEGKEPGELYDLDRTEAKRVGVVKEINFPYFHKGSDNGVLLIHGLAASPKEMEPLFSILKDRGMTVYTPRVAGHGTKNADMNNVTYEQWYNSLKYGYFAIKNSCRKVNIIGQSNGGLLASLVALFNQVDSLCLLAPAFKVNTFLFPAVKILHKISKGGSPRFLSPEQQEFNYSTFPFEALYQMGQMQKFINPKLPEIKVPVFLSVTKNDVVISTKAAVNAVEMMGSKNKAESFYGNQKYNLRHILTIEHVKDSILKEIADWAENPPSFFNGKIEKI